MLKTCRQCSEKDDLLILARDTMALVAGALKKQSHALRRVKDDDQAQLLWTRAAALEHRIDSIDQKLETKAEIKEGTRAVKWDSPPES
jgi:hypothetical protein